MAATVNIGSNTCAFEWTWGEVTGPDVFIINV
jgi:hypothetical protein